MEAGIDEAGRGPVLGPLVVGLVAARDGDALRALGVRDSKQLSARRRTELDARIRAAADRVETVEVSAAALDGRMARASLNDVEVDLFAELGRRVAASTFYLDACDVDAPRFGRAFSLRLRRPPPGPRVVSEHHADERYPLVSAASIVAKVRRDAAIRELAQELEPGVGLPLGSGYAHDPATRAFLRRYLDLHGRLPPGARAAWATSRDLIAARRQRTLAGL